ncbi:XRE family transcriptional regulator [Vibrio crassostreae]|jgi:hypothetical protein|uniref:hypothetical protein n=1 Tax=Vibrio crassostreae TaxID=246167 RepID=UPI00104581E3|nr:hypothetical protein [Vibrio crassostreae]NOH77870.1 hypothetical protein [Vibrio crassostreae]TCN92668.1 hypothetical protein EDB50_11016 [Vibrio crassostreae]CAK2502059.1 XRE family transcriptional regulator [Vibrio crassostreae]CAK2593901.1 XRE family transcriptional regulator [Vibrio crassostreae]CAK2611108.1 XRE family transcriptional regulator [Vibrio crassostreae]
MQITIPTIEDQQRQIVADGIKKAIKQLQANIDAPVFAPQTERDEAQYSNAHLLDKARYEPPHADIVGAYFRHFQSLMADYDSDKKLAALLGVSSDRRVREFKQGKAAIPYEIWDRFLVMTGRKPQTIIPVMGYLG